MAGQNQPSVLVLQPVEGDTSGEGARCAHLDWPPPRRQQIGMALEHVKFARPMTHDLMLDALTNLDARVDSMVIYGSKGQMFFAHLVLSQGGRLITLGRPAERRHCPWRFGKMRRSILKRRYLTPSSFPFLFKGEKQTEEELAAFKTFLDHISPEISEISNSFSFLSSVII